MSYCLNPSCQNPHNTDRVSFCLHCGAKLLLGDRYRSLNAIGQGSFGRTFLAVDEYKPSKPRCVIKQFFPQTQGIDNTQKAAELFQQEAVRLDELGKHPQIPELLAYFAQDEQQYLVQEFIDGQNLAQELEENGLFNETQIIQLLNTLLSLLKFVHERQVIHRDIKPENIICKSPLSNKDLGDLVLVDFGAAKFIAGTALGRTGTVIGTPGYIAPEQAVGKATFASDIYSLGVTCIHCLTLVNPFELFDIAENDWIWRQYLTTPVSDRLCTILDKMIQPASKRRYQSVEEVLQDLNSQPIEIGTSATAKAETSTRRTSSPSQLPSWRCVHTLKNHSQDVNSVAISPDGDILASGSDDRTIKIWNLETGNLIRTDLVLAPVWSVAISPDGNSLISGDLDTKIMSRNFYTGRVHQTFFSQFSSLSSHGGYVYSVAFHPTKEIFASGSADKTVRLWDWQSAGLSKTFSGHEDTIWSIAFNPNGQFLVSGSADQTIKVWDINSMTLHKTLEGHFGSVNEVAISPDEKTLASGSQDKTIKIWNLETGELIQTLEGHLKSVLAVAISPDGQMLASGSKDNTIKIWNLASGQLYQTISEHSGAVKSLAFSPNGRRLVSGSWDKTVKIWRRD